MIAETDIRPLSRAKDSGGLGETLEYRMLPQNLEAEQGLLACLMTDHRALERVSDFLRPYHFYVPAHQRIFAAILK